MKECSPSLKATPESGREGRLRPAAPAGILGPALVLEHWSTVASALVSPWGKDSFFLGSGSSERSHLPLGVGPHPAQTESHSPCAQPWGELAPTRDGPFHCSPSQGSTYKGSVYPHCGDMGAARGPRETPRGDRWPPGPSHVTGPCQQPWPAPREPPEHPSINSGEHADCPV